MQPGQVYPGEFSLTFFYAADTCFFLHKRKDDRFVHRKGSEAGLMFSPIFTRSDMPADVIPIGDDPGGNFICMRVRGEKRKYLSFGGVRGKIFG